MAGFTFVGRGPQIAAFRQLVEDPEGALLLIAGGAGTGKSHLLRRLRREAEASGSHFVQLNDLSILPSADLRHYAIISALAAGHGPAPQGESTDRPPPDLLPEPQKFLDALMTEDRRPPPEKLLRVFTAASAHLSGPARLVLLLDLGRVVGEEAFPLEYLARRLPERIKLVVAAREVPSGLRGLEGVTAFDDLPDLTEDEVRRLLEFHLGGAAAALVPAVMKRYPLQPMVVDLAAKIAAATPQPAETLAALPTDPPALCGELLRRLNAEQRALAECVARVPSGVDIACLRALTDFSDAELGRLLRSDAVRNLVITQRGATGPQAHLCHVLLAEAVRAAAPDDSPEARAFHGLAASYFLDVVQGEPTHAVALSAHGYHLERSGDKRQFIHDFPKTYKAKHSFGLFRQLATEYQLLLQHCDELGETSINRPVCLANLGRVYQELGEPEPALARYREALALHEAAGDQAGTAEQLANMASALQTTGQRDEAVEHLQRAAALDEAAGDSPALAADLNNLGILFQELGRHGDALASHQRALELHQAAGNDLGCANQLANMAAIHRARGDLHAAREAYQKAWILDSRTGDLAAQIVDLCNLGLIFQSLGDLEKAVASYQQAIELDRNLADSEGEAAHRRTLAAMISKLGRHAEALEMLGQALEIDRSIGNARGEARDLQGLAAAHRAAGELDTARGLADRAAAVATRAGDDEAQAAAERLRDAIDRRLGGEDDGGDDGEDGEAPNAHETRAIHREPADGDLWNDLRIVDGAQAAAAHDASPEPPGPAVEPADDDEFAGLEVEPAPAFDGGAGPSASPAGRDGTADGDLRRECAELRRRVAELEAELESYKQLVDSLRSIVGEAAARR